MGESNAAQVGELRWILLGYRKYNDREKTIYQERFGQG
jgi:hypothetical protein